MQTRQKQYQNDAIKTKFTLSLCCVFLLSNVYAQKSPLDSANIDLVEKEYRVLHPELSIRDKKEFTEINVFYQYNDLKFSRVQTPSESSSMGFGSKGIFLLNPKMALSGELKVVSETEKNVPYILTDERTTDQNYISNPAYFYAPRESNWTKQHYQLKGSFAYQPLRNVLIGVDAGGKFLKAYSNRDPRPEIGHFEYNIDAKLGYQIGKHTLIGKLGYFNRKKESKITYSNTEYNTPSHFDSYIRFNRGYGNYYYNDGYSQTWYQFDGLSYGLEYSFDTSKHNFLAGYKNEFYVDRLTRFYTYQIRDENNVLKTYRDRLNVAGLRTDRNSIYVKYLGEYGAWKWSSALDVVDQKDQNYDYQNLYTSYRAYNTSLNFRNVISKFNSNREWLRFYFDAKFGDQDIKDISVVLHKKLNFFEYQIGVDKEFRIDNDKKLGLEIKQGLYLPISSAFLYTPYQSTQENVFVKNIAIPDYFYDTSSRFAWGLKLKYLWDVKNVRYEFFASANQSYFMSNTKKLDKSVYNTNANSLYSFGINFYY